MWGPVCLWTITAESKLWIRQEHEQQNKGCFVPAAVILSHHCRSVLMKPDLGDYEGWRCYIYDISMGKIGSDMDISSSSR
jgi:hypothetical protein